MASEVVSIVDPDNGAGTDYTSLSAWNAGEQGDLTGARDEIAVAKCRSTSGSADATAIAIDGWTTSATQYILIWTDPAESYRHDGKWNTSAYRIEVSAGDPVLSIGEDYVRIIGVQIKNARTGHWQSTIVTSGITRGSGGGTASEIHFIHNIAWATGNYTYIVVDWSGYANCKVVNNVIINDSTYNHSQNVTLKTGGEDIAGYADPLFYNNTIITAGNVGILGDNANQLCINNLVSGATATNYSGTFDGNSDYNASDDTTSTGGANDRTEQSFTFVDADNDDYHLDASDTGAKDYGTDLSSDPLFDFTDDIDGDTRSGSWDIGADEYVTEGTTYTLMVEAGSMALTGQNITLLHNRTIGIKDNYHDNYLSSNSNLLRERYLSVFNSLLNFYSSIFDLIYYKLLNILNTIHNNNSIVDLNLKLEKLLLTDKILHEQFANNISVFLAGITDLSVKSIYHKNSPIENYSQLIPVSGQNPIDTDVYWNKSKCTIDSDGGIIANAESGSHSIYKQITSIIGATYILQAKIKPGNKNWAMIEVDTGNYTYFDLQNGVVGSTINGGIAGIESVGDGYYLCWVERIAEDVLYRSAFYPADSNNDWDFTGDGSTVNIYIKEISFKKFDFNVDLILNKIFEIISSILGNNSSVIENIISKGIVVKYSYHDNYENVINIILRDLVISSINCVNDLINDVVENEIDISIVVDNILNEIFSSNNNLDVQLAGSIGLIIFDSIISMYSGKPVLTATKIATLYNFIAKNTLYNFIAKNTLYNFIAKKI